VNTGATSGERASRLEALRRQAGDCQLCPQLVANRSQVVFGVGDPDADLMLIGEAPGASEDRDGTPFVGASGKLLDRLLCGIGIAREEVYVANVLGCHPPDNRDPRADEIANCSQFLRGQVELVAPVVVVTLGNFATKLLRDDDQGISLIHGQAELCAFGERTVWLYPVFHPAAALYRRPNLELLREDFARLPQLLGGPPPQQGVASDPGKGPGAMAPAEPAPLLQREPARKSKPHSKGSDDAPQLDLF